MCCKQNISEDFFSGIHEDNAFKTFYIFYHLIITLTAPLVLYSIVWYERCSADLRYRTLMNQLLSHCCLISLLASFTVRLPHALILVQGPFSSPFCSASVGLGRFLVLVIVGELFAQQTIKFLYIFKWSLIAALNDDFTAFFLTLNNIFLCGIFSFTAYFLGYLTSEVDYHVCTGRDPNESIAEAFLYLSFKSSYTSVAVRSIENVNYQDPSTILVKITALLVFAETIMIWLYSRKPCFEKLCSKKIVPFGTDNLNSVNPRFEEAKLMIVSHGGTVIFVGLGLVLVSPTLIAREVMQNNPADLNQGYGRALFYVARITMPLFSYYLIPLVTFCGNKRMRKTLIREFQQKLRCQ